MATLGISTIYFAKVDLPSVFYIMSFRSQYHQTITQTSSAPIALLNNCDPLQENRPLLFFYHNVVEACKVSRVENGVHDQIFFLFKILIFIPSAIYGPNIIT